MWPQYFPDQCPPADARKDTLEVYRLVTGNPPVAADFVPVMIEAPHRQFSTDKLCIASGVSVFKNAADAMRIRAKFKPLKTKLIAIGIISPEDGFVLETGSATHITWWLQTTTPHAKFTDFLPDVTN